MSDAMLSWFAAFCCAAKQAAAATAQFLLPLLPSPSTCRVLYQ
jgi:hypothetical protein